MNKKKKIWIFSNIFKLVHSAFGSAEVLGEVVASMASDREDKPNFPLSRPGLDFLFAYPNISTVSAVLTNVRSWSIPSFMNFDW